jgi:serine/threonine-protein kinase
MSDTQDPERLTGPFGRYEDLQFLGQGGMARVYRAYDPMLGRLVALKFIRGEDPELARRLMAEARAQAKIDHPHVCKVYEVGEVQGRPYIAMQYIRGRTLLDLRNELTLEQKVRLMQKVAEAAHVAHRSGLIHRDLKPANILVERNEEGKWTPYVLDFGLARELDSGGINRGLTATGVIVGSPCYMSPEQAKGDVQHLDRRCDIYSLGVTMYELLSGKLPFDGNTAMDILLQVINEEPQSLGRAVAGIPPDLSTIVMKCLEKDPARRYDSARALSEDLNRYLEGESILAKPAGLSQRLMKKARKNKVAVAMLGFALLTALVLGGVLAWVQWRARTQARYAAEFMQDVRYIESMLRGISMAPLHDVRAEENRARSRLMQIAERMAHGGTWAYGPGNNALGEGYLSLREYDLAREHLEKAWNSGYRQPSAAYALGRILGFEYQRGLANLEQYTNKEIRQARRKELEVQYRDKAIEYLKMARGSVESPEFVEGMIALYEGRYVEAIRKASGAYRSEGWSYEAKKLEGDVYVAMGRESADQGAHEEAGKAYSQAGEAYGRAKDLARSEVTVYLGDCLRWIATMRLELRQGTAPGESFQQAMQACDQAILINPDRSEAYALKSQAFLTIGVHHLYMTGEDPRSFFNDAIRLANEAARRTPRDHGPYTTTCAAYQRLGEYQMQHAEDPRPSFNLAIEQCGEALKRNPNDAQSINVMGAIYLVSGQYEMENGKDPRGSLKRAVDQYRKAVTINPQFTFPYNNLGSVYYRMAIYEANLGQDAEKYYQESLTQFRKALQLNPKYAHAYINMGNTLVKSGDYRMDNGKDPRDAYLQALKAYSQAMEVNPSDASTYNNRSVANIRLALFLARSGETPEAALSLAISDLQKALELRTDYDSALLNLGEAYRQLAVFAMRQRGNPESMLDRARASTKRALQIDINYDTYQTLGSIEIAAARWNMQRDRSPEESFDRASSALQKSLRLNATDPESYRVLAEVQFVRAQWMQDRKVSAAKVIDEGLQSLKQCLALMHVFPQASALQGALLVLQAKEQRDDASRISIAGEAALVLKNALQQNPLLKTEFEHWRQEAVAISTGGAQRTHSAM